jgi:hypothetical protein
MSRFQRFAASATTVFLSRSASIEPCEQWLGSGMKEMTVPVGSPLNSLWVRLARHYEIFYCLENWIRDLVSTKLHSSAGDEWWNQCVPSVVRENAERNASRERDAAVTPRSAEIIDYTTFGELSNIIDSNWESFSDLFNSKRGLTAVLSRLNLLRGPIAHCSAFSPDEKLRLELSLSDFFRLMS